MCIDYRMLNKATRKDHFPLPFIDEMLERLAKHSCFCYLDGYSGVAKMASHAIFQYNVLAIDDIHNTWTNMIIKMTILRLLGSSDDKEKIGVARPKALRFRSTGRTDTKGIGASDACRKNRRHGRRESKPSQLMGTG